MTGSEGNPPRRRLVRRPAEGKIGGVCAGLADYFNTDVALVRAAWVVLSIWPGAVVLGVLAYLAAWLLMPRADAADGPSAPAPSCSVSSRISSHGSSFRRLPSPRGRLRRRLPEHLRSGAMSPSAAY